MTEQAANLLLGRIERGARWPAPFERKRLAQVLRWAAFRESDRPALRLIHGWRNADRPYMVDPLGPRISEAYADLLFSEDPQITAANEADQGNLDRIVETSNLPTELHHAQQINSSEGEVWWRVMSAPGVTPAPQITFHSREEVVPHFVGNALVAAAFVSEFADPDSPNEERPRVFRHLEIQTEGRIENALYLGTSDHLGQRVELERFSETADLLEVFETGLPGIACDRILNKRGRDRVQGASDYDKIEDYLLALNEALTIGVENVRLVGKQRAVVPREALEAGATEDLVDNGDGTMRPVRRPSFDASEEILTTSPLDAELGKEGKGPFTVLTYSLEAQELVTWQEALAKTAASRAGLTAQMVGSGDGFEGEAATGTALRVRLLPAIGSGRGRGRPWDGQIPRALLYAQLLDSFPRGAGGYGRNWRAAGDAPAFERADPLPRDQAEEVTTHAAAVQGEVESIETAVRELHPDRDEAWVSEEIDRIRADGQARARSMGLGTLPDAGEQPPGPES